MQKKHVCFTMLSACVTSFFLSSCVDNDYDLNKNIDLTIQVGGDLSLPGCNTEEITLKKIFDLDESDPDNVIKADASGNYALSKEGTGSDSDVEVDRVEVKDIESSQIETELKFKKNDLEAAGGRADSKVEDQQSTFTVTNDDVTKDIVSIVYADTDPNDMMPADIELSFTEDNNVTILHLEGFTIEFPEYLGIKLNTSDPDYSSDYILNNDKNTLSFASKTLNQNVNNGKLRIPLLVNRIDFTKLPVGQGLIIREGMDKNRLYIEGLITVNGNTYILRNDLSGSVPNDVVLNLNTEVILGNPNKDVKLTIAEVRGMVDPKIDVTVDPVSFDNLPDFLSDDEVVMDLANPKIILTVTNTSPVDVNIYGDLIAAKNGNTTAKVGIGKGPDAAHNTTPILVKANDISIICLSRLGEGAPANGVNVKVDNLNDLIRTIPDDISMENIVAKALQQNYDIELGKTFFVSTSYNVDAPLMFGEDLNIVYNDTINDWNEDIADYDIEIKEVNVVMDAVNRIPLDLKMSALPIDVNGEVIPESDIRVEQPENIKSGNGITGEPASSSLTVKLITVKEGAMRRLDGLLLRVEATTNPESQGIQLNENQTLKLDNIRIKVPGGVKANLN